MTKDSQALTNREPQELAVESAPAPAPLVLEPSRPTAREMRVVEINSALAPAYAKAGTLELSTEETAALTSAFPDSAVEKRPHDGLFYIPHILISDRLTQVFGPGKWTMLRRWENIENNTIFAEWIMIVRGVYIGESVGAHQYIPSNPKMNYSDALESTRGEALRRIAGKYLSCGSQVWSPAYCRELERGKLNASKTDHAGPPAKRLTAPAPAKAADVLPKAATETTRTWMLTALKPYGDEVLLEYAQKNSILLPTEALTDWPLEKVPTSQNALRNLMLKVETFRDGGAPPDPQAEAWREFPMPFGKNAGVKLEDLEKSYLFGLWANYEVETEYNGKPKKPETIERDELLREMLDAAGEHYEFVKPD